MFNKSNFCHIASNNRNEQKGSVFIYKTSDTLAQVTQSGYFNEKLIDINVHDLIIHVQYDPVARTLKKSVLIVTERTMDNVETAPILDQTIGDDIADLGDQVAGIEEKIPGAASAANQLADKAFVTTIKNAIETTIAEINQSIATAVNYDNITNCITEIPQDIKLELADGVLTLKAGSTVYVPNGTGVFDVITTKNDLTVTASTNGTHLVGLAQGFGSLAVYINAVSSATEPTLSNGLTWYDTANNVIKRAWGGSWQNSLFSLPLAAITVSNGAISSIDQVFNGFGYIGSTVFAFPGVKGLVPDGRNEDGTLNNISITTQKVIVTTKTADGNYDLVLENNFLSAGINSYFYDKQNNINTWYGNKSLSYYIGSAVMSGGKFVSLKTKTAFHAVDYNDTDFIAHQAMPSRRYQTLTMPENMGVLMMPEDGYIYASKAAGEQNVYLSLSNTLAHMSVRASTESDARALEVYMPVSKGDAIQFWFNSTANGTVHFIYTNGAK